MENKKINDFKEVLRKGMVANFEKDGCLTPIVFFYSDNTPMISEIPNELLSNPQGKVILSELIRSMCKKPTTLVAGIIIEASSTKLNADSELAKLVLSGNIKVSELKEKQDIILMVFSTPEKEELIAYNVDIENKTIVTPFTEEDVKSVGGTFSNFFSWNKN